MMVLTVVSILVVFIFSHTSSGSSGIAKSVGIDNNCQID